MNKQGLDLLDIEDTISMAHLRAEEAKKLLQLVDAVSDIDQSVEAMIEGAIALLDVSTQGITTAKNAMQANRNGGAKQVDDFKYRVRCVCEEAMSSARKCSHMLGMILEHESLASYPAVVYRDQMHALLDGLEYFIRETHDQALDAAVMLYEGDKAQFMKDHAYNAWD